MKIELYSRITLLGRKWFFRIRASNGEIIAQSESYSRKVDAIATAQSIRQNVGMATIEGA